MINEYYLIFKRLTQHLTIKCWLTVGITLLSKLMKYPAIQTNWQNGFAQGSPLIQKIFLVLQYSIAHHDLLPLTNIRILSIFQIYVF